LLDFLCEGKFALNYGKEQSHPRRTHKAYFSITQTSSFKI